MSQSEVQSLKSKQSPKSKRGTEEERKVDEEMIAGGIQSEIDRFDVFTTTKREREKARYATNKKFCRRKGRKSLSADSADSAAEKAECDVSADSADSADIHTYTHTDIHTNTHTNRSVSVPETTRYADAADAANGNGTVDDEVKAKGEGGTTDLHGLARIQPPTANHEPRRRKNPKKIRQIPPQAAEAAPLGEGRR